MGWPSARPCCGLEWLCVCEILFITAKDCRPRMKSGLTARKSRVTSIPGCACPTAAYNRPLGAPLWSPSGETIASAAGSQREADGSTYQVVTPVGVSPDGSDARDLPPGWQAAINSRRAGASLGRRADGAQRRLQSRAGGLDHGPSGREPDATSDNRPAARNPHAAFFPTATGLLRQLVAHG